MFVADQVSKSVVFIGAMQEGVFRPQATGFLVLAYQRRIPDVAFPHLVTTAHVLATMQRKKIPIYCCLNRRDGSTAVVPLGNKKWFIHPEEPQTTDVAILPFWVDLDVLDHDYIPVFNRVERTPRASGLNLLNVGAEIFAISLYRAGSGAERNIPIVRIGNVASMPDDLIPTRHAGDLTAYLVELRSSTGLSGSPVFANPPGERSSRSLDEAMWGEHVFVGLMHGHLDAPDIGEESGGGQAAPFTVGSHTGIGVVIPGWKIVETLYQPDSLTQMRSVTSARRAQEGSARELGVIPLPRRRKTG
ncbi:MAG TPA: hypothetical protein VN980_19730 [Alphaproteobacteria bacterium]|nr:hypothetical protein [Alphaproteobacteria bacterium]